MQALPPVSPSLLDSLREYRPSFTVQSNYYLRALASLTFALEFSSLLLPAHMLPRLASSMSVPRKQCGVEGTESSRRRECFPP